MTVYLTPEIEGAVRQAAGQDTAPDTLNRLVLSALRRQFPAPPDEKEAGMPDTETASMADALRAVLGADFPRAGGTLDTAERKPDFSVSVP